MMSCKKMIKVIVLLFLVLFVLNGCTKNNTQEEFSLINKICELATMKCYYHNVAQVEQDAEGVFSFLSVGYKKYWVEYSGYVNVGIDVSQVRVQGPDSNGVVEVFVPDAQVQTVNLDNDSISDPIVETGLFTEVKMSEKLEALGQAQEDMGKAAENDRALLVQAKERARSLIKEYIENVGELVGKSFTVKWIE